MSLFFIQQYIVDNTSQFFQFLTEIQNAVNSTP